MSLQQCTYPCFQLCSLSCLHRICKSKTDLKTKSKSQVGSQVGNWYEPSSVGFISTGTGDANVFFLSRCFLVKNSSRGTPLQLRLILLYISWLSKKELISYPLGTQLTSGMKNYLFDLVTYFLFVISPPLPAQHSSQSPNSSSS